jgi:hypothetical protein
MREYAWLVMAACSSPSSSAPPRAAPAPKQPHATMMQIPADGLRIAAAKPPVVYTSIDVWNDGTIVASNDMRGSIHSAAVIVRDGASHALDGWSDNCRLDVNGLRMACVNERELRIVDLRTNHEERATLRHTYYAATWVGDHVLLQDMTREHRPIEVDPRDVGEGRERPWFNGDERILDTSEDGRTLLARRPGSLGSHVDVFLDRQLVAQIEPDGFPARAVLCGQRAFIVTETTRIVDEPPAIGFEIRRLPKGDQEFIRDPALWTIGPAAACTPGGYAINHHKRIVLFDSNLASIGALEDSAEITALGVSPDGKLLASAHDDGTLLLRRR